jgi:hypothetical protein
VPLLEVPLKVTIKHTRKLSDHIMRAHRDIASKPSVSVGILGSKAMEEKKSREKASFDTDGGYGKRTTSVSLVEVATFHEYGGRDSRPPERSFLRSTLREQAKTYRKFLDKALTQIYLGKLTVRQTLGLLGEKAVSDVRNKIRSNIPPALKPSTIKRKGSSIALIDTGQLIGGISYKVNQGEKKK